jgi:hypothetical protein
MEPQQPTPFGALAMLTFLMERAYLKWSVALRADEVGGRVKFDERLQVSFHVTTQSARGSLADFTTRYPEGHVTLVPLVGEGGRTDDHGYIHEGYLQQDRNTLYIRLLVLPQYLAALATVIAQPFGPPVTLNLSLPESRLVAWDGQELLDIEEASIDVGPFEKLSPIPARKGWLW